MTHKRQAIRDAAAVAIAGLTTSGANVFTTRLFPLENANLPAFMVSTEDEEAELIDMSRGQVRTLRLNFTAIARAGAGQTLENTLDTMAEELETVLTGGPAGALAGVLDSLDYAGSVPEFDVEDTDAAIGYLVVAYDCTYYATQGAPSA